GGTRGRAHLAFGPEHRAAGGFRLVWRRDGLPPRRWRGRLRRTSRTDAPLARENYSEKRTQSLEHEHRDDDHRDRRAALIEPELPAAPPRPRVEAPMCAVIARYRREQIVALVARQRLVG